MKKLYLATLTIVVIVIFSACKSIDQEPLTQENIGQEQPIQQEERQAQQQAERAEQDRQDLQDPQQQPNLQQDQQEQHPNLQPAQQQQLEQQLEQQPEQQADQLPDDAREYIYFLLENGKGNRQQIVYFERGDFDLDGNEEAVVGFSYGSDNDYSEIYVLRKRNEDGQITLLNTLLNEENLNRFGYGVYEIQLVELEDREEKVIYLGLTNYASMVGFYLTAFSEDGLIDLVYSASATGSGLDELVDMNENGKFDGYIQYRSSYDVLYYPVIRMYMLEQGEFQLSDVSVKLGEYPTEPKDVIIEYLSLGAIIDVMPPNVAERMAELCSYCAEHPTTNISNQWYDAMYDLVLWFDDRAISEVDIEHDSARITTMNEHIEEQLHFELTNVNGNWTITNIEAKGSLRE